MFADAFWCCEAFPLLGGSLLALGLWASVHGRADAWEPGQLRHCGALRRSAVQRPEALHRSARRGRVRCLEFGG